MTTRLDVPIHDSLASVTMSPTVVLFRTGPREDSQLFWDLRHEEQPDLVRAEHDQWWTTVVEHRFLAYEGGTLVGTIRISQDGVISTIVAKAARGRGIATAMQREILPIAKALGFARLSAVTAADNVASQRALLRAGWTPIKFEVAITFEVAAQ